MTCESTSGRVPQPWRAADHCRAATVSALQIYINQIVHVIYSIHNCLFTLGIFKYTLASEKVKSIQLSDLQL